LTCTDIEQQWGILKASTLAEYQAKPLAELCHVNDPKVGRVGFVPQITKEIRKKWENILVPSKHNLQVPN